MNSTIRSYQDLAVWQLGIDLVEDIYRLCGQFPKTETFGLMSQLKRAVVSVPANIAEGHARKSRKEFLQFLSIALGSLAEVETHMTIAQRLTYLPEEDLEKMFVQTNTLGRMLRGLQKSLKQGMGPRN